MALMYDVAFSTSLFYYCLNAGLCISVVFHHEGTLWICEKWYINFKTNQIKITDLRLSGDLVSGKKTI